MINVRKILLLFSISVLCPLAAWAQKVTFEVNAPKVVAVGEIFRIEYVTNSKPQDFTGPQLTDVDVIAGPSLATSQSVTIVNGNMTKDTRYTYTYVLQCNSERSFEIPEATLKTGGKTYTASPFKIQAINENTDASVLGGNQTSRTVGENKPILAPDDILLRAIVDKNDVYKSEPVKVTYKLYRRVPLNLESARFPSYDGFWAQQLDVDGYPMQREAYNDKIYDTHIIREDLLFPQQAGKLTIDPLELNIVAQIVIEPRRQSIIDDFFNGPNVQEVRRKISSAPVTVNVRELPAGAPSSFNGAVGEFRMNTELPKSEVAANSAFTYSIRITGSGNLPQIQAPKLSLPGSFEQYNVKTTESLNNTADGIYGYRQFEYPVIARVAGEYDIEPVQFTYFNPRLKAYQTLSSPAMKVRVLPDSTSTVASGGSMISGLSKEDIKILGHDIRFIKLGSPRLSERGSLFITSWWYFLCVIVIAAAFATALVLLRKMMRERRNSAVLKGKRANRVALQRFRAAEGHMKDDNPRGFYEEMLRALWGYMGDKLKIPASLLTKENVREELLKRGIAADTIQKYIDIIAECEYAQYAPAATGRMNEVYAAGVDIVSKLENIIGK